MRMHWLVEQEFLDCRVGMVRNRNPKGKFFDIFGNYLKIRPIREIKKTNGTTPGGDLSYEPLFIKIHAVVFP